MLVMQPEQRGRDFRIGDVLHDAWAFDPKVWRGDRLGVAEDFSPAVALLLKLLAERRVEYAVAGEAPFMRSSAISTSKRFARALRARLTCAPPAFTNA